MISPHFKTESKKDGYETWFFPVKDFDRAKQIQQSETSGVWVFIRDMKPHRENGHTLPAIILPRLLGRVFPFSEDEVITLGYKPFWIFFRNPATGEVSFGNKPSFSHGTEIDKQRAREMTVVDLERFLLTESL